MQLGVDRDTESSSAWQSLDGRRRFYRLALGRHGLPSAGVVGRQTLQARKPCFSASVTDVKCVRFLGFVRRPGGQLGRQNILVVVQALIGDVMAQPILFPDRSAAPISIGINSEEGSRWID
jgi:hypothetical protein